MNKITIKNGNNKYDITINRVKYVFSSNQDEFKIKLIISHKNEPSFRTLCTTVSG